MKEVIAIRSFIRSDLRTPVRAGARISGEPSYIQELIALRLVREVQHHEGAPENKAAAEPVKPGKRKAKRAAE